MAMSDQEFDRLRYEVYYDYAQEVIRELGIKRKVKVHIMIHSPYFEESDGSRYVGAYYYRFNYIEVAAGRNIAEVIKTIRHELRHAWQHEAWNTNDILKELDELPYELRRAEIDAFEYESKFSNFELHKNYRMLRG